MSEQQPTADEFARLKRGAETLGQIVDRQCRDVLDATEMHAVIDETGDGDWGLVWERMAELCAKGLAAERAEATS